MAPADVLRQQDHAGPIGLASRRRGCGEGTVASKIPIYSPTWCVSHLFFCLVCVVPKISRFSENFESSGTFVLAILVKGTCFTTKKDAMPPHTQYMHNHGLLRLARPLMLAIGLPLASLVRRSILCRYVTGLGRSFPHPCGVAACTARGESVL